MTIGAAMLSICLLTNLQVSASAHGEPVIAQAEVDASPEKVWDAFTTREGLESWMVASGDVDLRIGGLIRTTYRKSADLDGDTAIHQEILSMDPGRMISFRTVKSPKDFPFSEAISKSWTVVYIEPLATGRTRVTVKMLGYTNDPQAQKMRSFFELGNKATLDALVKRFAVR